MLFPYVGEWTAGDMKDVESRSARLLMEKFGKYIHPFEKEKTKPKKAKAKEISDGLAEGNKLKEAVEKASESVEEFYKFEGEGGED